MSILELLTFKNKSVGDTVKVPSEQIAVVLAAISGVGLTRTVRSKGWPTQVPMLGVSV